MMVPRWSDGDWERLGSCGDVRHQVYVRISQASPIHWLPDEMVLTRSYKTHVCFGALRHEGPLLGFSGSGPDQTSDLSLHTSPQQCALAHRSRRPVVQ